MRKYIQPETIVAEVAMTIALLAGSTTPTPTPDANLNIGGGGDPIDGR